ncbi:MAG TPA: GTP cyclohydrolase, FolE2/MptA family [Fibrobacteria bacterium]|nr:GTP cyclohydrolase, FolE2/MptA family [Fibrobacteria bacterium]
MENKSNLPDVQSESARPARSEVLAGIDRVKIPVQLPSGHKVIATLRLAARVPEGHRGVHMSRLYRMLAGTSDLPIGELAQRLEETAKAQETTHLIATLAWEDIVGRDAPVTRSKGFHPYRVEMRGEWTPSTGVALRTRIESAAMLACPCSKALSGDLGFHNQRGILQAEVAGDQVPRVVELMEAIDTAASNRVHPVLRREDEKEVIDILSRTNSFRFVEDAASRLLDTLDAAGFEGVSIHVRSMESIHAHDAVAWAGARGQEMSEGIQL